MNKSERQRRGVRRTAIQPPKPNNVHVRKCWDCDNVAGHADDVVPYVLCTKCGSQDTRRVKVPNTPDAGGVTHENWRESRILNPFTKDNPQ